MQNGLRKSPPKTAELPTNQSAGSQPEGKPLLYQNGISESEVPLLPCPPPAILKDSAMIFSVLLPAYTPSSQLCCTQHLLKKA